MSRFVQRKLPGGGQRDSRDSSRRARRGWPNGSCRAWQDLRAMHDLRGLCSEKGPSLARYSPGVFPNGDLQGILNTWRAYLAKTSSFWMHGGDILPGRGVLPSGAPLGIHQGDILPECGPSSARNALRGCFIQRARLRLSEMSHENASSRRCRALVCVAAPPAPPVAGVGGGGTDRTEAEPFAAKRSETG